MPITFYPHEDDLETSSLPDKLEVLTEAAERFKAVVLDTATPPVKTADTDTTKRRVSPRDLTASYNWDELSKLLRNIREMPEANAANKLKKAEHLAKLAEIYEVLRGAKMAKLEAVRLALVNEANQLKASAGQVA